METGIFEKVATQEFNISVAEQSDVVEAIFVTKVVMNNLLTSNSFHPDMFDIFYDSLKAHIDSKSLLIIKKNNVCLGILTFDEDGQEFKNTLWHNHSQCLYISRIYVLPVWRNMGVGTTLLKYTEGLAKEKGFRCIRLDASSDFDESNILLTKNNYSLAGSVFYDFQKTPFNCYEKHLQ